MLKHGIADRVVTILLLVAACVFALVADDVRADDMALSVGLARVKITPTEPIWMAGYASRDKPSAGVLADLYAKAMAIEDARGQRGMVLTVDVIGFSADVAEFVCARIIERTGLRRGQILLCPSHTHTGPVIGIPGSTGYGLEGAEAQRVHDYCAKLADDLAETASAALEDLQPAQLFWGVGVTDIVMNRREFTERGVRLGFNPRGYVDRSVPVLRVSARDGALRAVVFGCACHNTTLTGQHYVLSGDYAGFAQQHVEQQCEGVQAMFVIGCGGSANPYPRGTIDAVRDNGRRLGQEVCRVLDQAMEPVRGPLRIVYDHAVLPLEPVPPRDKLAEMTNGPSYVAYNAKLMLQALDNGTPLPTSYSAPLAVWQFGDDLTWVSLSGEVVNGYVPLLERALGPRKLWVSAYANDCYGYLPTAQVLVEGGYETRCLYSEPGFFTPAAQDVLVNKVCALAEQAGRVVERRE